jgi:protein-histidine pros-kinase
VGQRFTPSELGLDRGDERVCIEVRDEGPGCPGSQLETLFEPFVRGGSELTRRAQGTGIGLALVRDLVGRMRGQVQARNRDPGLELRVSLPTA